MSTQTQDLSADFENFKSVAETWLSALDNYSLGELQKKPSDEQWSLGQVYTHCLGAGQGFFMRNAKKCIRGEADATDAGKNEVGEMIYQRGGFPDQRFGMPQPVAAQPPQPESVDQLRETLQVQLQKMGELAREMEGFDEKVKVSHPIFGNLNAREWYIGHAMHLNHHLRQKARIDEFLGKN